MHQYLYYSSERNSVKISSSGHNCSIFTRIQVGNLSNSSTCHVNVSTPLVVAETVVVCVIIVVFLLEVALLIGSNNSSNCTNGNSSRCVNI